MLKIIVVDDELWVRRLIRSLIPEDDLGVCIVGEAEDGLQAQELCRRMKPDIVITDIRMPVVDGLELMEILHKNLPDAKIIVLSGYDDFSYAQKAVRMGVFDYLLKPVGKEELVDVIKQARSKIHEESRARKEVDKLRDNLVKVQDSISAEELDFSGIECETQDIVIKKVLAYIHKKYITGLTLEEVADKMFMNRTYLSRLFKTKTGKGFNEYINDLRVKKSMTLLENTQLKISEIANAVGYQNTNYYIRVFRQHEEITPYEYRQKLVTG